MSHEFDEALRGLPEYELPHDVQRHQLSALFQLPPPRRRRRGRRVLALTAGAVVAAGALGIGTAAALGAFSTPPTDRSMVHCFATTDLHDPGNHIDGVIAVPPGAEVTVGDAAASALEICADDWRQGRLIPNDPTIKPPQPEVQDRPVPPLAACVLDNGQVAVFPGPPSTCAELGLPQAIIEPATDGSATAPSSTVTG